MIGGALALGDTFFMDDITVTPVSGNHGLQATTSAQPKWQTGGLARFDGSDDCLLTTLNPTTSGTMLVAGTADAVNDILMGSIGVSNGRCYIGTDSAGRLSGGIGTQGSGTIFGGDDIRGVVGVNALSWDGTTVKLFRDGATIYEDAQSGAVNTTTPIHVGALNNNGTSTSFADMDSSRVLYIAKALTAAQIAAITTKWGTS